MDSPEPSDFHAHVESAYRDFVEGVDRAAAPLRMVARLAAIPQGAENCVDVWEVIDTVAHFVDVIDTLHDRLDLNLELTGSPGGTATPTKSAKPKSMTKSSPTPPKPKSLPKSDGKSDPDGGRPKSEGRN